MLFSAQQKFITLNQNFLVDEADQAIATSNVLLSVANRLKQPIVHFWTLENTVILGHMDTKLKSLKKGLEVIDKHQYNYFFRNAGGLGVISDEGIINLGFYFPDAAEVSIQDAYQQVADFIGEMLEKLDVSITTGEIIDSYCPGSYDLSINGKKIAGIAQRRAKGGVSILLYLSLNGNQERRGELMRDFYQVANQPVHPKLSFPNVNPNSMKNLDDEDRVAIGASNFSEMVLDLLREKGNGVDQKSIEEISDPIFKDELYRDMEAIKARKAEVLNAN